MAQLNSSERLYNVHAKVFLLMILVYTIVTALTSFQVANLVPYFAKYKCLSPRATATYQPITAMTDEEYNERYMVAIMQKPSASTPATTTPHLPAPFT
ncbi:hypothetical protein DSO57_1019402 [Entomophthora muscae]|uniref:Uncharacterized protein n=1 Tax=Entomophthora muscae TaxID=34485 RepID=A0ACC2UDK2_9FUNG|nr:hypothetical protein DSO57_1019402 [Entomophthora muscae]